MYKLLLLVIFMLPMKNPEQISFSVKDPILKEIIQKIESQTIYKFAYREDVDLEKRLSGQFNFEEENLLVVLEEISRRTPYTLKIVRNNIAIGFDPPVKTPVLKTSNVQSVIQGTVTDESGMQLPGVNILEKGTTNGVQTDFDGNYSIEVAEGAVLVFSFLGLKTVEHIIGESTTIDVVMMADAAQLEEVVVTALGISREKRSLGYSTQEVSGEDVNRVPSDNVVNALSGQVAGVRVTNNSNLGGSSNVIVRGSTSLTGNNQALFVVDGVPVSNSNFNTSDQQTGAGGFDYGNLASDINPNNIKSINVLKGAAATALYGSRATNGVVIIETKTGSGAKKPTVSINSGVTVGFIDKSTWPEYQYQYGTGYGAIYGENGDSYFVERDVDGDGVLDLVSPSTAYGSFGAPFDEDLMVYQWDSFYEGSPFYMQPTPWVAPEDDLISFFETPVTLTNNVSFAGSTATANYRISYSNFQQEGILPNSNLSRDNFTVSTSIDISEKITAAATANYVKTDALGRNRTGNETGANAGNVLASMRKYWAMNVGIQELKDAYFNTGQNVDPFMGGTIDNPYWVLYENYQNDTRDRIFGNASLSYEVNDWLDIEGRVSLDTYSFMQEERVNEGSAGAVGMYSRRNINFSEMNYDLNLNFHKDITEKFNINGVLGTNIRRNHLSSIRASTNGGLVLPGLFSLSNSMNLPAAPDEVSEEIGVDGYYGLVSFGFNDMLYLDLTGRFDHSSTLPSENNTFFYPSIAGSFVFSELINPESFISFGKLRLNYAEVGSGAPANSLVDILNKPTPFGSVPLYGASSTKNNPDLLPETTESVEGGIELRFFDGRLRTDLSLYKTNSRDQIIPVAVSTSTGYTSKYVNAGEIENKGIELALSGKIIDTDDLGWNMSINWARNKSEVLSLFEGGTNLLLGEVSGVSINANVGEPYGTIQGTDFIYLNGQRVINQTTGEFERTSTSNNIIGNVNPDWNGGVLNELKYKNFALTFLIDVQKGGDIFSQDISTGNRSGLYKYSVGLNELGNPIRSPIEEGGGILLEGVGPNGEPNQVRTQMVDYRNATGSVKAPDAYYIYDASYVKLREATITYNLPISPFLEKLYLTGAQVSVVGSNLWIIHKNLPFADPEANLSSGNLQGFQNGVPPATRNIGFNVRLQF